MKKLKNLTRENLDVSQLMDPKEMGELKGGNCEGGWDNCTDGRFSCHGNWCTGTMCNGGGWFNEEEA